VEFRIGAKKSSDVSELVSHLGTTLRSWTSRVSAKVIRHDNTRYPYREPEQPRRRPRPVGAICEHCHYRPARPHKRYPHLATPFCSDSCRNNHYLQAQRAHERTLTETVRRMLGLPDGRGPHLTVPELEAIVRRLRRLLPYGGLAMRMPPRRHRRKPT
jgi:hypothetical protein